LRLALGLCELLRLMLLSFVLLVYLLHHAAGARRPALARGRVGLRSISLCAQFSKERRALEGARLSRRTPDARVCRWSVESSERAPELVNFRSMSIASDLQKRLVEMRSRLDVLLVRRERASGEHSFARARQDAGVTDHDAGKMAQFAQDEVAGDAEMTDLRREIVSVGDELERDHGTGLRARAGRALRSKRR
jgi:hypothetical protein